MSAELKDCPMCGCGARYVKHSVGMPGTFGYDAWHGVACAGCGVNVGASDRRFRVRLEAATAWNRRPPESSERVPLTDERVEDLRGDANRGYNIEREDYFKAFRDAERAHGIPSPAESSVQINVSGTAKGGE